MGKSWKKIEGAAASRKATKRGDEGAASLVSAEEVGPMKG